MLNSVVSTSSNNNSSCYPIYIGVRSTAPPNANTALATNPLTNNKYSYVLVNPQGTNDYTLYRRDNTTGQFTQSQSRTPFLFYDVSNELICKVNFGTQSNVNMTGNVTAQSQAGLLSAVAGRPYNSVTPMSSTTFTANGVTTANSTVPPNSNLITLAVPVGVTTEAVAASVTTVANLSTPAPTGVSLNANLVKLEPSATYSTVVQLRDSQMYLGTLQINGPHRTEARIPVAMSLQARAANKSIVSTGDVGAYTAGHAVNCSVLHADNQGSHVHALARENSKVLSLGAGSTAAGEASCGSVMSAGGTPNFSSPLCSRSRFRLMAVGAGVVQHRRNIFALSGGTRCPTIDTLLENSTPISSKTVPPLPCRVCTDITDGEHAPGVGAGSLLHAVAKTNSLVQTSGDGSTALGVADCNETHVAAGRGSFVQGRNNLALAPYSQAVGQDAVSHMYGQISQGVRGTHVGTVPDCCSVCQNVKVMTTSHAYCKPVVDSSGIITGFQIEYRLVLGNNPMDPVINTPDGITITNFALPSLVCPGVAKVDVQLASPAIINGETPFPNNNSDSFAADYCFYVQRRDTHISNCHMALPLSDTPVPIIGSCQFSPGEVPYFFINGTAPTGAPPAVTPIIETDPRDNLCGGFTMLFTEFVPAFLGPNNTIPNPRISPLPTTANLLLTSRTTFNIDIRIICANLGWTQAPFLPARVACVPREIPAAVAVTIPTFTAGYPLNNCPPTSSREVINNNGDGSVVGSTFSPVSDITSTIEASAFNLIQDMNQQFGHH
jgi:hypothetical protein